MVGIMLEPAARGGYDVAAVAAGASGIEPGERLLEVDGHDVTRMPFSRVVGLLGGAVGTMHALVLERGDARTTVDANVQSIFQAMPSPVISPMASIWSVSDELPEGIIVFGAALQPAAR